MRLLLLVALILAVTLIVPVHAQQSQPAYTPIFNPLQAVFMPASATQNHWWIIDYWNNFNTYGSFTAEPYTLNLPTGDFILLIPLNLSFGSPNDFVWFQFDLQLGDNSIDMFIWNINQCWSSGGLLDTSSYNPTEVGLPYVVGDSYSYWGNITGTAFRFRVSDLANRTTWFKDYSVPSVQPFTDQSCFSPASAVEGYTTESSVSGLGNWTFTIGRGINSVNQQVYGSTIPSGVNVAATNRNQNYLWTVYGNVSIPEFSIAPLALILPLLLICWRRRRELN